MSRRSFRDTPPARIASAPSPLAREIDVNAIATTDTRSNRDRVAQEPSKRAAPSRAGRHGGPPGSSQSFISTQGSIARPAGV